MPLRSNPPISGRSGADQGANNKADRPPSPNVSAIGETPATQQQQQQQRSRTQSPYRRSASGSRGRGPDVNLDNFEDHAIHRVISSPRSLLICKAQGVLPIELVYRPMQYFKTPGVTKAIAQMRFEHYEERRVAKRDMLRAERDKFIEINEEQERALSSKKRNKAEKEAAAATTADDSAFGKKVDEEEGTGHADEAGENGEEGNVNGAPGKHVDPETDDSALNTTTSNLGRLNSSVTLMQKRHDAWILEQERQAEERRQHRAERERHRQEVIRRAAQQRAADEERRRQKALQVENAKRQLMLQRRDERTKTMELRRMKNEDHMEMVERLKRIKEYEATIKLERLEKKVRVKGETAHSPTRRLYL